MTLGSNQRVLLVSTGTGALLALVFLLDITNLPGPDKDISVLYIFPVILSMILGSRRILMTVASAATILPLISVFFAPRTINPISPFSLPAILVAIWTVAILSRHQMIVAEKLELARNQLKMSEELFRTGFESSAVGAYLGTDGRFLRVNRTLGDMLGYSIDELGQAKFSDVVLEKDKDFVLSRISKLYAGELDRVDLEMRCVRKDGRTIWTSLSVGAIRGLAAERLLTVAHVQDITKRKEAEDRLRESEEKYRAVFDSSLDGLYVRDLDGNILDVNQAMLDMVGLSSEDIRGAAIEPLFRSALGMDEGQLQSALEMTKEVIETGIQERPEIYRLRKKNGDAIWVEMTTCLVRRDNAPYAVLVLVHDITGRKRDEAELLHSKEAAEAARARAQTYLDFIAHDLTNILTPVMMYSEMLSTDSRSQPWVQAVSGRMTGQIARASSFVRNIRRLSEAETNEVKRQEPVDLRVLLKDVEENIRARYPAKRFTFERDIRAEGPVTALGKEFIQNICEEIMANSAEHGGSDDVRIDITVRAAEESPNLRSWLIEMADYGKGIPDSAKRGMEADVFDPSNRFTRGIAASMSFMALAAEHIGGRMRIEDRVPGDYTKGARIVLMVRRAAVG